MLKVKSSTLLFLTLSASAMELNKKQKFPSGKKNSENSSTKKEDYKTSPWNLSSQNQYPNMLKKIFTKKSWGNKKDNVNKGLTDSRFKFRKACIPFLPIFFPNRSRSLLMNSLNKTINLSPNPCLGTAKLIYSRGFRRRKMKEDKESSSKSSINTMITIYLKESRKWLKEMKNPRAKDKGWELKVKQQPTDALSSLK